MKPHTKPIFDRHLNALVQSMVWENHILGSGTVRPYFCDGCWWIVVVSTPEPETGERIESFIYRVMEHSDGNLIAMYYGITVVGIDKTVSEIPVDMSVFCPECGRNTQDLADPAPADCCCS